MAQFDKSLGVVLNHKHSASEMQAIKPATKTVAPASSGLVADYYTDGTNDHVEINAAINAVTTAGGTVLLKVGTYTIGAAVVIKSNVILKGEGMTATTIKKVDSGNFSAVAISTASNFQALDFKIDGNRTNSALGRGLSFNTASSGVVERVLVTDAVEGIFNVSSTDITYRDCISDGNYEWNYYTSSGTRIKIYNCQSLNAKAGALEGFGMAFYGTCLQCEAVGNYIYNSAHNGLQCNSGSASSDVLGMIFRDNKVVNAGLRGIFITDDGNSNHVKKMTVANNVVTGSTDHNIYAINMYDSSIEGNKSYSATLDGIVIELCQNCIVSGNTSDSNTVNGFQSLGSTKCTISKNQFTNNSQRGLLLTDKTSTGTTYCIIDGNYVTGNTASGITALSNADYNTYTNNNCLGNTTSNFSVVGANNEIGHNIGI